MSISAMKQALKALEWNYGTDLENIENCTAWLDKLNATIPALRQAIAEAEKQEPVAWEGWVLREVYFSEGEPIGHREPQPVAWMDAITKEIYWRNQKNHDVPNLPLYTAPVHASNISQEPVDETAKDRHEPVAWVDVKDSYEGPYEFHGIERMGVGKHLLYTAPPQREWVGLEDEEINEVQDTAAVEFKKNKYRIRGQMIMPGDSPDWWFARAIEAKLKEKNT